MTIINHPVSLYVNFKRSNELMAHSYSHLYKISWQGFEISSQFMDLGEDPDMLNVTVVDAIINRKF